MWHHIHYPLPSPPQPRMSMLSNPTSWCVCGVGGGNWGSWTGRKSPVQKNRVRWTHILSSNPPATPPNEKFCSGAGKPPYLPESSSSETPVSWLIGIVWTTDSDGGLDFPHSLFIKPTVSYVEWKEGGRREREGEKEERREGKRKEGREGGKEGRREWRWEGRKEVTSLKQELSSPWPRIHHDNTRAWVKPYNRFIWEEPCVHMHRALWPSLQAQADSPVVVQDGWAPGALAGLIAGDRGSRVPHGALCPSVTLWLDGTLRSDRLRL